MPSNVITCVCRLEGGNRKHTCNKSQLSELIVQKYGQSKVMGENQITIDNPDGKSERLKLLRDQPKEEIVTLVIIQLMPSPS